MSIETGGGYITSEKIINHSKVDAYFSLRKRLRKAQNIDEFVSICCDYGIDFPVDKTQENNSRLRKEALSRFVQLHLPESKSTSEHKEKIERTIIAIVQHLKLHGSHATLWVGGSYGRGKVDKTTSDIDLYMGAPHSTDVESQKKELDTILDLEQAGLVFTNKNKIIEDLTLLLESGTGKMSAYAITADGIPVDMHIFGNTDLRLIHSIIPGYIRRSRATEQQSKINVSFTGKKMPIPRLTDITANYAVYNGEVFKGGYTDNLSALGSLVYDPDSKGEKADHNIWLSMVKAFLTHNHGYQKDSAGKVTGIDRAQAPFLSFLKTLYYQSPQDYSPEKLLSLEARYNSVLEEIAQRYKLSFF